MWDSCCAPGLKGMAETSVITDWGNAVHMQSFVVFLPGCCFMRMLNPQQCHPLYRFISGSKSLFFYLFSLSHYACWCSVIIVWLSRPQHHEWTKQNVFVRLLIALCVTVCVCHNPATNGHAIVCQKHKSLTKHRNLHFHWKSLCRRSRMVGNKKKVIDLGMAVTSAEVMVEKTRSVDRQADR